MNIKAKIPYFQTKSKAIKTENGMSLDANDWPTAVTSRIRADTWIKWFKLKK